MFERYTEKARRVIFFARYEASQFGSPYIETEHLLLGLLREDKALANRFLRSHAAVESIRKQIEGHTTIREKVSTSVDLPRSHECKRACVAPPSGLGPDGIPRRPRGKSDFRKQSPFPRAFEMQAPLSDPLPPKAGKWIAQLQYGRPVKTDTAIRFHSTSASGGFSQFFRNQRRLRTYYS